MRQESHKKIPLRVRSGILHKKRDIMLTKFQTNIQKCMWFCFVLFLRNLDGNLLEFFFKQICHFDQNFQNMIGSLGNKFVIFEHKLKNMRLWMTEHNFKGDFG